MAIPYLLERMQRHLLNFSTYRCGAYSGAVLIELFCLQNSLIVGVQPQVSGKVGSLVGSFLGGQCSAFPTTVEFYRKASCRGRNKNADENARKILLLKRHYESVLISFA